jgi:hypothetical protein
MVNYLPVTVQLIPVSFHSRLLLTGNGKYFYSRQRVWATPYEVIHGEPFPDASIVVPFGCAALILLDADDRAKFKSRCSLLIFLHYAVDHPLFTYAFFSLRSKRVLFRQDCIFLTSVFPIREARVHASLAPEGEVLVTFRAPFCVCDGCPAELSFDEWQPTDPLPEFNDDITGFGVGSPSCNLVDEPEDHPIRPVHFPDHPAFGPVSYVGVPIPVSPLGAESCFSTTDSAITTQLEGCIPDGDSLLEQKDPDIMDEFDLEPDISAEDFPTVDQSEANGVLEDEIFTPPIVEIAQSKAPLLQIDEELFALNDGVDQSERLPGSGLMQE